MEYLSDVHSIIWNALIESVKLIHFDRLYRRLINKPVYIDELTIDIY